MITFIASLTLLILGYIFYGRYISRLFGANPNRKTPAYKQSDGIDYIPMPTWKAFMIQFLNIAGLGPIFGAIMGAKYGTASYLWIVFGTIFAGGVHDYLSGMLSIRHHGENLPNIISHYLGHRVKVFICLFLIVMLTLVGAVFISQPADLLAKLTPQVFNVYFWMIIIFIYYLVATMFPIDKIVGRFYPIFAFSLLFMAVGILVCLLVKWPSLPEMWNGFGTKYAFHSFWPHWEFSYSVLPTRRGLTYCGDTLPGLIKLWLASHYGASPVISEK